MPIKQVETEVFYLKMNQKPTSSFAAIPNAVFQKIIQPIEVSEYLNYYSTVGEKYNWIDRLLLPQEQLSASINAPNTDIFILSINQKKAGFVELIRNPDYTEILYFGLFPDFVGKGLGNNFLRIVIEEAWSNHPKWIQLNTCKLDHPNALSTYQKAGFEVYETTVEKRNVRF